MRTAYQMEKELESLYMEQDRVIAMRERAVCMVYNADSKQEILDSICEEIKSLKVALEEASLPGELVGEVYGWDYY